MLRSQPISSDEKVLKRLGLVLPSEDDYANRETVQVETVNEMFEFDYTVPWWRRTISPLFRLRIRISNIWHSLKRFSEWRKLFEDYRPMDIYAFLPLYIHHLEMFIAFENSRGISTKEHTEYKTGTAQEAIDIMRRLVEDDYDSAHTSIVEEKWGKFPYEKTTYSDGSVAFEHLAPDEYNQDMRAAYEKAAADAKQDLERLGELTKDNMVDWWV